MEFRRVLFRSRDVVEHRAINLVNAYHVAQERNIETAWTYAGPNTEGGEEIELRMRSGDQSIRVAGALLGESLVRIPRLDSMSVVYGKGVSLGVGLGGCRTFQKK